MILSSPAARNVLWKPSVRGVYRFHSHISGCLQGNKTLTRRLCVAGSTSGCAYQRSLGKQPVASTCFVGSRMDYSTSNDNDISFRKPLLSDAKGMYDIVVNGTLDTNSAYCYMIFAKHFTDECIVATKDNKVVGFILGYRPPTHRDTIFVWQVGVDQSMRGRGVAGKLLLNLAKRLHESGVNFLEATVTPSNEASRNLFQGFARRVSAECIITPYFKEEDFPQVTPPHEAEDLFRIGPFSFKNC